VKRIFLSTFGALFEAGSVAAKQIAFINLEIAVGFAFVVLANRGSGNTKFS